MTAFTLGTNPNGCVICNCPELVNETDDSLPFHLLRTSSLPILIHVFLCLILHHITSHHYQFLSPFSSCILLNKFGIGEKGERESKSTAGVSTMTKTKGGTSLSVPSEVGEQKGRLCNATIVLSTC